MDHSWLGVRKTTNPNVWELPVSHGTTGARGKLYGGCVIAAAVVLLEELTDRPALWATSQFISAALPGDIVRLEAQLVATGYQLTQARVNATVNGRDQTLVLAALGAKDLDGEYSSLSAPEVPDPSQCEPIVIDPGIGGFRRRAEVRLARARSNDPERVTQSLWLRYDGTTSGDRYSLILAADSFPQAVNVALGRPVFGVSMDNTIRFMDPTECDWLLATSTVQVIHNGIGHGTTHLWSQEGQLLAIASQTCGISEIKSET